MIKIDDTTVPFKWLDYAVIGVVLLIYALIGIYYRFSGGRQKTVEEYFSANRSLSSVLLAFVTMIASISAVGVLAVCSEIYIYGVQFILINLGLALCTPIIAYLYLPVFYKLKYISVYEYLETRFGTVARLVASIANYVEMSLLTGLTVFAPALALEATTGLPYTISVVLISLICTFYTSIGGLKAVLATDIFQGSLMFATVCCVIGVSCYDLEGGIVEAFNVAYEGDRMNLLNFDMDPTVRHTFWSLVIGGAVLRGSELGVGQITIQRLLSARSLRSAQMGLYILVPLMTGAALIISISGMVLYAWFKGCDPVVSGKIASFDQIMPYFARVRMSEIPGLLGLFIAGVFSASLGTTSAILNSLSAIALADYVKPILRKCGRDLPESKAALCAKILGVASGLLCMAIAFAASRMGTLLQATMAIRGAMGGAVLGLFSLGLFVEVANERGAVIGTLLGLAFSSWLSFGQPKPPVPRLPVSVDECFNATLVDTTSNHHMVEAGYVDESNYFYLYRLSYMWNPVLGFVTTMVCGYIASLIDRHLRKKPLATTDPDLFTPILANRIRRRLKDAGKPGAYPIYVIKPDEFHRTE